MNIFSKSQQGEGQFNFGEIKENKPIGFPQDGGILQPYSNLFYWAHAWAEKDSLLDIHPHQGFEIISFVNSGVLEHYDTGNKKWIPLNPGDLQVMRTGSGISHAERFSKGTHIFQIWFNPDLRKTLNIPATYQDIRYDKVSTNQSEGYQEFLYKNENEGPQMDSEVEILRVKMEKNCNYHLAGDRWNSVYVINGSVKTKEEQATKDDFITSDEDLNLFAEEWKTDLFIIRSPKTLLYPTYAEMMRRRMFH